MRVRPGAGLHPDRWVYRHLSCKTTTVATDIDAPVDRLLDLPALLARKSHFLLGPRQTGKTFLIRQLLPAAHRYDLLDHGVFLDLSRDPARLGQEIGKDERLIVIDEVQRLPALLNEVHRLIIDRGLLPSVYFSDDSRADLNAYAGTYLQQEIVAEGANRNVPAFSLSPCGCAVQRDHCQLHESGKRRAGRPHHRPRVFRDPEADAHPP